MAVTLNDAEVAFYQGVLDDPEGKSVSDLRYAYFLAALDGALPSASVKWDDITGKPATFPPTTGTTATTAKPGNYVPTSGEVSNGLKAKAQVAALVAVTAANGVPAAGGTVTKAEFDALVTLANANKTAINAIISALKA